MNNEPTIKDVLDSMTQKQLVFLYHILGCELRGTVVLDSWLENEMDKLRYTEPMRFVTKYLMKMVRKINKSEVKSEFIKQMAEQTKEKTN